MIKLTSPKEVFKQAEELVERLQNERDFYKKKYNEALNEAYKDNLVKEIKEECDKAKASLLRGFGISEKEHEEILKWIRKHDKKCRGHYKYIFTPTPFGVAGDIVCNICGEKFNFQEIG